MTKEHGQSPDPTSAEQSAALPPAFRTGNLSRRRMLQAMGVAGVAAAAIGTSTTSAQAAQSPPFTPRGRLKRRPNFLVVIVDEQRAAPSYESPQLTEWRAANLKSQALLRSNGFDFTNHQIMATACCPSRTSFLTGQYPSLHGVTQTPGGAKEAIEEDTYWLDKSSVPTMGNWFREAGYDTYYKGKWHVSDADLYQAGSYDPVPSFTDDGDRDPYLEEIYLEAGLLEQYGFTGWIGPEPHGSNPFNSGSSGPGGKGRDAIYAEMGVQQLQSMRDSDNPWLLVTSFVNPHDISLWGAAAVINPKFYIERQLLGSTVPQKLFSAEFDESANEDLEAPGVPSALPSYRQQGTYALQPPLDTPGHQRFYYQLQKNVDDQIGRVLKALADDRAQARDTVVIYLSDHGDLLGSHGGLYQKWHQAYDEVLRVPMVFHNPELFPRAVSSDAITSHADLLPTMLGLAGVDQKAVRARLQRTHTQIQDFPGRDLSGILLGEEDDSRLRSDAVYFMSDDEPLRGSENVAWFGMEYKNVVQPNHIESVLTLLPTGPDGSAEQWKLVRFWDNPAFWTYPNNMDVQTIVRGLVNEPGVKVARTTVKSMTPTGGQDAAPADEYQLFNMTADPREVRNLAIDPNSAGVFAQMLAVLDQQRDLKRLEPMDMVWADGVQQLYPFTETSVPGFSALNRLPEGTDLSSLAELAELPELADLPALKAAIESVTS